METEHAEGSVAKMVEHLKGVMGVSPDHRPVESEGRPTTAPAGNEPDAAESPDKSPDDLSFSDAVKRNAESARREDGE